MDTEIESLNTRENEGNIRNEIGLIHGNDDGYQNKLDAPFECKLEVLSECEDEQDSKANKKFEEILVKEENADPKETTEDESMAVEALRQLGGMFESVPQPVPPPETVKTVEPYRQHVCNICGESFERKTDLGNHIVCHQVDRPHACRICGNLFRRKADLQNHMVCHQVERPHRCTQCGADFQRPSSLTNHMKIHTYPPGRALLSTNSSVNSQNFTIANTTTTVTSTTTTVIETPVGQMPTYNGWDVNYSNNTMVQSSSFQTNSSKETIGNEFGYQEDSGPVIQSIESMQNPQCNISAQQPSEIQNMNDYENVIQINNNGNNINFDSERFRELNVKVEENLYASKGENIAPTSGHIKLSDEANRRPHVCRHCGLGFSRKKALESHARLHQDHWGSPVECDRCEEMFPEEIALRQHQETCVGQVLNCHEQQQQPMPPQQQQIVQTMQEPATRIEPTNSTQLAKVGKHCCTECEKRFTTKQKLFRHMWIHRKRPFVCEFCGVSLIDRAALDEHRRDKHPGDTPFTCNECGKSFASRQGLWEHGRVHAGSGVPNPSPFLCQRCGKSFASRQGHLIHMRTHTGERPYGCRFCWKAFRDGGTLRKHERIHTGERPHVCPLCPRAFNQKVVLREHVRWVHAARNSDGCQLCGYVVNDREALCAHIVKHSDQLAAAAKAAKGKQQDSSKVTIPQEIATVDPYCTPNSNCSYTSCESSDANLNTNVITEVKNEYSCDMCGEAFKMRTELVNHVRIHI